MIIALIVVQFQDSIYRASMKYVVGVTRTAETGPELGDTGTSQTMRNLLESQVVSSQVIDELNLDVSDKEFAKRRKVVIDPESSVLTLRYDAKSRQEALDAVTKISEKFEAALGDRLEVTQQVIVPGTGAAGSERTRTRTTQLVFARVFDPPHVDAAPVAPKPVRTIAIAGVLGLVLGVFAALIRDGLDHRLRGRRDAAKWFRAPVLATLPQPLDKRVTALIASRTAPRGNGSPAAPPAAYPPAEVLEPLQLLRANIEFVHGSGPGSTILVTSAGPEAEKAAAAVGLGVVLALGGHDVVCVDADLADPALSRYAGSPRGVPGLAELLDRTVRLDDALIAVPLGAGNGNGRAVFDHAGDERPQGGGRRGLHVLTAGDATFESGLGPTEAVTATITAIEKQTDYVVIDGGPLLDGQAFPLVGTADLVLVVAKLGETTRERAQTVSELTERLGARRVGVLLVDTDASKRSLGDVRKRIRRSS